MEAFREERVREIEMEKLKAILAQIKALDMESNFIPRMFIQCSVKYIKKDYKVFQSGNRETCDLLDLIQNGSNVIDKCTYVFSTLALEVDYLVRESQNNFFNALLLYGEDGI